MPADGYSFYLKNYGTAALSLKVLAGGSLTNTSSVDVTKVKIQLSRIDGGVEQPAQTVDLQTLTSTGLAINDPINPSTVTQYKLRVAMDADAFSGASASIGGLDLVFSGAATH
jgi:hypothetical protein